MNRERHESKVGGELSGKPKISSDSVPYLVNFPLVLQLPIN